VLPSYFGWIDWKDWHKQYGMFGRVRQFIRSADILLLHHMAPNQPDVALIASASDLNSDSEFDSEADENGLHELEKRRLDRKRKRREKGVRLVSKTSIK
jgi:hypothetical protein